ncbi:MAG: hypothetical protein WA981_14085 [Glaciecola sp.]
MQINNNLTPFIETKLSEEDQRYFDLKIEYIGLSVGNEGSREAYQRLNQGHKKETDILHDINSRYPHLDCYAVLFKPGRLTEGESGPLSNALSFSETVAILEKSLISQFQPCTYNKHDLDFPYNGGVYVSKLKQMERQQIRVTVESPDDYGRLYSDEVEPAKRHRFQIDL